MDYGAMLGDAYAYTVDALWGKWARWLLLLVSCIIFPLILGYTMEIYRGKRPAPEPQDWAKLFIDGLKLFVAGLIYAIPVILVFVIFGGFALLSLISSAAATGNPDIVATNPELFAGSLGLFFIGILIAAVLGILISLISTIGMIRFARTDRIGEAFNFSAILDTIGRIGWANYIVALIILWVVAVAFGIVVNIFGLIPFLGVLLMLVIIPAVVIFQARYLTRVYESAGADRDASLSM